MLSLLLLANTLLFSLRISGNGSFPKPLSAAEEREWLSRYAAGDSEARTVLIERNLRLVAHIIKKYYTQNADQEDLISIGTIGLIKGISSFNPAKGARLATYAARCIENEILMYLRKRSNHRSEVSIDEPLNVDWDGNELLLSDVLGSEEDGVGFELEKQEEKRILHLAVAGLTPRERLIVELRYGFSGQRELTQKEVADMLGISQSYISRLEKKIIAELREEIADKI